MPFQVETLNEALKIAALDIAEAAGDQLLSDEDEEEAENSDNSEKPPIGRKEGPAFNPTNSKGDGKSTIYVNPDGSYSFKDT